MATLIYATTAAAALYYYGVASTRHQQLHRTDADFVMGTAPYHGQIQHISKQLHSLEYQQGRFHKAIPTFDERGVPIWLVDYGDFSHTITYEDPTKQRV